MNLAEAAPYFAACPSNRIVLGGGNDVNFAAPRSAANRKVSTSLDESENGGVGQQKI
jgi:hypothetical protein